MKKCKDCEHFKIIQNPLPDHYDAGIAKCEKHDLITEFYHKGKFNRFVCVEDDLISKQKVLKYLDDVKTTATGGTYATVLTIINEIKSMKGVYK